MTGTPERIAVVTDSTAYLPDALVTQTGLTVVPLTVVISGEAGLEGVDVTPADVAKALEARRVQVTTSRPAPEAFGQAYQELFDAGAAGIVSVHLSAQLSGTYEAARRTAAYPPIRPAPLRLPRCCGEAPSEPSRRCSAH